MKKAIFIVIIVVLLGWAFYDFTLSSKETAGQKDEVQVEKNAEEDQVEKVVGLEQDNYAPDFELSTLNGETVKLSDFKGKKIMLNFWATWCPPCRAEMPDLEKLSKDNDVVVLGVNLRESEPNTEQVEQFVEEFGLTFPIVLDDKGEVATTYEVQPIPTSYMIDGEGRIRNKAIGPLNYELMVQVFDMIK